MHGCEDTSPACALYSTYVRILNNYKRSYLSKHFLLNLSSKVDSDVLNEIKNSPVYEEDTLSVEKFMMLTRVLVRHFLENVCPLSIITSKKIRKNLARDYLSKRREISAYLQEHVATEDPPMI